MWVNIKLSTTLIYPLYLGRFRGIINSTYETKLKKNKNSSVHHRLT